DDRALPAVGAAGAGAGGAAPGPYFEESRRIDDIMEGSPTARPADRHADHDAPRRLLDPADHDVRDREQRERELRDRDAMRAEVRDDVGVDARDEERRLLSVDDASALHPRGAIDPRELDGRVRIDEGATVDDRAPVGGVLYEGAAPTGGYGRPDERYGPEYGSGRIGMDRVVSRHPRSADLDPSDVDPADASRRLDDAGDRTLERRAATDERYVDDRLPADRLPADRLPGERHEVRYRRYDDLPPSDLRR
ncbi:hypothetical protein PYV61_21395, partial [Roseisolibacter sp. H3M3-2]